VVPYYCQTPKVLYVDYLDEIYMKCGIKGCPEKNIQILPAEAFSCQGRCSDTCNEGNCHYEYTKRKIAEFRKASSIAVVVDLEFLMWYYSGQCAERLIRQGVREGIIDKAKEGSIIDVVKNCGKRSWDMTELVEAIETPVNFSRVRHEVVHGKAAGDMVRVHDAMERDINSSKHAHEVQVKAEMAKFTEEYGKIKVQQATLAAREANLQRCLSVDADFLWKLEQKRSGEIKKLREARVEFLANQKRLPDGERIVENGSHKRKFEDFGKKN